MNIDASDAGYNSAIGSRLAAWVAVARENDDIQGWGTIVVVAMTVVGLIMHGADFGKHIHNPLAVIGAMVSLGVPLAATTGLALTYRTSGRWRWWLGVCAAALIALFFALLAPVTAGEGWLAVLLIVLATLTYYAVATAYLVIIRPWMWIPGAPE